MKKITFWDPFLHWSLIQLLNDTYLWWIFVSQCIHLNRVLMHGTWKMQFLQKIKIQKHNNGILQSWTLKYVLTDLT